MNRTDLDAALGALAPLTIPLPPEPPAPLDPFRPASWPPPPTRLQRAATLIRRIWHVLRAVMPRWLLATFAVCLIIPGPFDEIAVLLIGAVFVAIRRDRARAAWNEYRR